MAKFTLLEEIHPVQIIREVKKWPVLYSKDNRTERASVYFRTKIWKEVAKALFDNWDSFEDQEKDQKVTDLMKKWRHLRDTFKRELAIERKIREGNQTAKKKTYVYFKHLLFLLPHINVSRKETLDNTIEPKLDEFFNKQKKKNIRKTKKIDKRNKIIHIDAIRPNVESEVIDEDKHFLLSLIPSFKKMDDDEKLIAKVEILKVIKAVRSKSITDCSGPVDSLSYDVEDTDTDTGDIKVELLQTEADRLSMDFDSDESEHSD